MSQLSSKESSSSNKDELDEITETYYKNLNDTKSCNPPKKQEGLIKTIKSFLEKHPIITELVKTGAEIVVDKVTNNYTNKPKQSNDTLDRNNSQPNNDNSGKDYPENRSSPTEHDVSGYDKKNGTHVNGYKRGGKKNNNT